MDKTEAVDSLPREVAAGKWPHEGARVTANRSKPDQTITKRRAGNNLLQRSARCTAFENQIAQIKSRKRPELGILAPCRPLGAGTSLSPC